ncbi:ABC transporter substrate-binding protein [Mesorhizobium sp. M4A.F.Ca.ET.050.02.1.1]|uniref:extracellular solute-binding protein n=1 Tax=unclassified Mesorhizobium TaxID=325217 RepID=UPI000FCA1CC7|nr:MULTISPECIES: extracellular solute-binding protein [unclassified Mesorhizobium]RUX43249.1 ABC transporter substrate-binding protein [Mesorhizobium sp. M4A.F.Ca.ET.050.02.1.1]RWC20851.1 MAG: ABC transporter substrate-binding protein [Mesorhizobium sp.]RWD33389.1 MAG: ABC transporter substrate-binding protein [Mesorhizobium sp.]RWD37526.1 MAG: ABC transporter substrate-binding protein [Mesorhizobium sp.]TIW26144.1 MAG: ABC transporter substrate-binding protein [Mesorhizobium sp.]
MGRVLVWLIAATSFLTLSPGPVQSEPKHAIAMQGEPALPADYTHFNYANPDAPKGGSITYCVVGSFDNLNPFILKSLRTTARGMLDLTYGNLVFEPLMQRNYDEAFSLYGLLADSADMDPERKSIEFHLNPNAKWSDGQPVTPEDVLFTYDVFTDKGRPPYSVRMSMIAKLEKTGEHSVKFTFNDKANRETPLIIALTPIIPRHAFDRDTFDKTTLKPLIGSGPYTVDKVQPGQRIVFKRNPDYWGKDLPSKRGFDNYDQITIEYFLNDNAKTEAFKKGICAVDDQSDPVKRERDLDFPAFHRGEVIAETFDTGIPPVVTGFLFNTRLEKFSNPVVRRALGMLYDFEWANKNLFGGKYTRTMSYWQNSELSALGHPAGDREKALLAPYPGRVPADVMEGTWRPPVNDGTGQDRKVLKAAFDLLKSEGYAVKDGVLLDPKGNPFGFEILTASQDEERFATIYQRTLQKIGIDVTIRSLEADQIQSRKQRFDFEVLIGSSGFSNSLSPGIEQTFRWGSSEAKREGSFNLAGVADPAIDAAMDAMLKARTKEDYVAAVRVLDRLLISGNYMVPMQYNTQQWLAYWNYLEHPQKTPIFGYQLPVWWRKPN